MNRIFGKKRPEAPAVNISDVGTNVDGRITDLDLKVQRGAQTRRSQPLRAPS